MNEKKKVILAITKANWGGAQKYVFDLALNIPKDKFKVKVIVGEGGDLSQRLQENEIEVIQIKKLNRKLSLYQDWQAFRQLIKIIRNEKPDIVHLNSSKMGILGGLACRLSRVPKIVFTSHGWAFNEDRSWWQKKIIRFFHLLTIVISHKTIAVSEQTKKQIEAKNKTLNKITVIRNGVSLINFLSPSEAKSRLETETKIKLDGYLVGCIAELHKNKGLTYLIQAVKILDRNQKANFKLIVIGEGEERQTLQNEIDLAKLNDKIFLVGKIDNASQYLKAFNLFVLPSITEALPYVLLEAGQAGLPIISTRVGGIAEIIDDAENGLIVKSADAKDLSNAINYLITNSDKSLILSHKIQEKINQEFDLNKMIEKTIALY